MKPHVKKSIGSVGGSDARGRFFAAGLALAMMLGSALPVTGQMRRGGRVGTSGTSARGADPALAALVATFEGTVREVGKKTLTIELTNGNSVEFRITKKTEYLDGTKAIHLKDLPVEAFVKIDGVKDGFGYITANKVVIPAAAAGPAPEAEAKQQLQQR